MRCYKSNYVKVLAYKDSSDKEKSEELVVVDSNTISCHSTMMIIFNATSITH